MSFIVLVRPSAHYYQRQGNAFPRDWFWSVWRSQCTPQENSMRTPIPGLSSSPARSSALSLFSSIAGNKPCRDWVAWAYYSARNGGYCIHHYPCPRTGQTTVSHVFSGFKNCPGWNDRLVFLTGLLGVNWCFSCSMRLPKSSLMRIYYVPFSHLSYICPHEIYLWNLNQCLVDTKIAVQ